MRRTVQIEAEQTVLIDALQGENFFVHLATSIQQMLIKNVTPGQLYVFAFAQDGIGGHTVQWGSEALNASPVDPAPDSTTVQSFIGTAGGELQASLPATTYLA